VATKCRYRGARRANLYRLGADGLEPITMVMVEFRRGRAAEKRLALGSVSLVAISLPVPLRSTSSTSGGQVFRSKPLACLWHCHACNTATRNPEWAGRAPEERDEIAAPHAGHGLFASRLVCRTLSLPQSGRRVLWTKVNRSESRWQVPVRLGAQCLTQQRPTASGARPSLECFRRTDTSAPPAESPPGTKIFFLQKRLSHKGCPLMG